MINFRKKYLKDSRMDESDQEVQEISGQPERRGQQKVNRKTTKCQKKIKRNALKRKRKKNSAILDK